MRQIFLRYMFSVKEYRHQNGVEVVRMSRKKRRVKCDEMHNGAYVLWIPTITFSMAFQIQIVLRKATALGGSLPLRQVYYLQTLAEGVGTSWACRQIPLTREQHLLQDQHPLGALSYLTTLSCNISYASVGLPYANLRQKWSFLAAKVVVTVFGTYPPFPFISSDVSRFGLIEASNS
ncbi:hypothetical protein NPIL_361731 [Nephila pilipes]|uniref:Uncharacterized protein n=1 Tax=Nephila pilipes TaxID=299642 RepID=A0A8X6QWX3_NEPPI|nr:hypothetical protein NPIL_361731 [Nephila pilipes]